MGDTVMMDIFIGLALFMFGWMAGAHWTRVKHKIQSDVDSVQEDKR